MCLPACLRGLGSTARVIRVRKEAVPAEHPKAYFTIPHFGGYSPVLGTLSARGRSRSLVDGWLTCAPPNVRNEYAK